MSNGPKRLATANADVQDMGGGYYIANYMCIPGYKFPNAEPIMAMCDEAEDGTPWAFVTTSTTCEGERIHDTLKHMPTFITYIYTRQS